MEQQLKCLIRGIPFRLHTRARKPVRVSRDDFMYMRHPPLPQGESYHLEIPGHKCLKDQSANSEKINTPRGRPEDVLYDTSNGQHKTSWQIAKLPVAEILDLKIPNKTTLVMNLDGTVRKPADEFTFEVIHEPTACVYPHCSMYALKNKTRPRDVASGVKSAIRLEFAQIAERSRVEMLARRARRGPHGMIHAVLSVGSYLISEAFRFVRRLVALRADGNIRRNRM